MKNQHVEVAGESNINEIQKNAVKSLEEEGFTCTVSIKGKTVKKTIPFENAVKELSVLTKVELDAENAKAKKEEVTRVLSHCILGITNHAVKTAGKEKHLRAVMFKANLENLKHKTGLSTKKTIDGASNPSFSSTLKTRESETHSALKDGYVPEGLESLSKFISRVATERKDELEKFLMRTIDMKRENDSLRKSINAKPLNKKQCEDRIKTGETLFAKLSLDNESLKTAKAELEKAKSAE